MTRFLDAHPPKNVRALFALPVKYRGHYNHRRRHQALKAGHTYLTPAQAREAGDQQGCDGIPIDIARLRAKALAYRDRALAK